MGGQHNVDATLQRRCSAQPLDAALQTGCCTRQGGQFCYAAKESECDGTQTYHNDTACHGAICCINPAEYPGGAG